MDLKSEIWGEKIPTLLPKSCMTMTMSTLPNLYETVINLFHRIMVSSE